MPPSGEQVASMALVTTKIYSMSHLWHGGGGGGWEKQGEFRARERKEGIEGGGGRQEEDVSVYPLYLSSLRRTRKIF